MCAVRYVWMGLQRRVVQSRGPFPSPVIMVAISIRIGRRSSSSTPICWNRQCGDRQDDVPFGCLIPPTCHPNIKNIAVSSHGPPARVPLPLDGQEDLLQAPLVAWSWAPALGEGVPTQDDASID